MADVQPLKPRGVVVNVPPLPGIPAPVAGSGVVKSGTTGKKSSGFDLNGLLDGVLGIAGKFFDYKNAQISSSGSGGITYQPGPANPAPAGGGFDLSNPIVLVGLAGAVYLLTNSGKSKQ